MRLNTPLLSRSGFRVARSASVAAAVLLLFLSLLQACGSSPERETVDGVEYVRNASRPAEGEALPLPLTPEDLITITGGRNGAPLWSAVRDVRAGPDGSWIVTDMHLAEIAWFGPDGRPGSVLALDQPPMALTSPVAAALTERGEGIVVDMALRRLVVFDTEGRLLSDFRVEGGLPVDLEVSEGGIAYVLTSARPFGGREQITQVKAFSLTGDRVSIAGGDSLLLEHRGFTDIDHPIPTTISLGRDGVLYAAAMDYTIHQLLPDGRTRIIQRARTSSRVPDYVLEQRRRQMERRVTTQRTEVPLTEETEVAHIVALDEGGLIVQTNEWHPDLLDPSVNEEKSILLLDRFSGDGTLLRRYAIGLPLPRMTFQITDAREGYLYGFAVPFARDGSTVVFRFRIPAG